MLHLQEAPGNFCGSFYISDLNVILGSAWTLQLADEEQTFRILEADSQQKKGLHHNLKTNFRWGLGSY